MSKEEVCGPVAEAEPSVRPSAGASGSKGEDRLLELRDELNARGRACRNLIAEVDAASKERLQGKAVAYEHAAQLLSDLVADLCVAA